MSDSRRSARAPLARLAVACAAALSTVVATAPGALAEEPTEGTPSSQTDSADEGQQQEVEQKEPEKAPEPEPTEPTQPPTKDEPPTETPKTETPKTDAPVEADESAEVGTQSKGAALAEEGDEDVDPNVPIFGEGKERSFRVGAETDAAARAAGKSTVGSSLHVVTTYANGSSFATFDCVTTAASETDDGSSFCSRSSVVAPTGLRGARQETPDQTSGQPDQLFVIPNGGKAVVTQNSAAPDLVKDEGSETVAGCPPVIGGCSDIASDDTRVTTVFFSNPLSPDYEDPDELIDGRQDVVLGVKPDVPTDETSGSTLHVVLTKDGETTDEFDCTTGSRSSSNADGSTYCPGTGPTLRGATTTDGRSGTTPQEAGAYTLDPGVSASITQKTAATGLVKDDEVVNIPTCQVKRSDASIGCDPMTTGGQTYKSTTVLFENAAEPVAVAKDGIQDIVVGVKPENPGDDTAGSVLSVVVTKDGAVVRQFECTTTEESRTTNPVGASYCPGDVIRGATTTTGQSSPARSGRGPYTLAPGTTATITQKSAVAPLQKDPEVVTVKPCQTTDADLLCDRFTMIDLGTGTVTTSYRSTNVLFDNVATDDSDVSDGGTAVDGDDSTADGRQKLPDTGGESGSLLATGTLLLMVGGVLAARGRRRSSRSA